MSDLRKFIKTTIREFMNENISISKDFDVDYYEEFWKENCEELGYSKDDWESEGIDIFQANIDSVKDFKFPLPVYRGVNLANGDKYIQKPNESWSLDIGHSMMFDSPQNGLTFHILKGYITNLDNLNVRKFVELAFTNNAENEIRPKFVSNIKFYE